MFKTFDERRESALKKFRDVQSKYPKTGAAILSRLAEGSLLLDKHEPDPALTAFTDVKGSALAAADQEVKGRAIEGMGFAYELKAATTPADAHEEPRRGAQDLQGARDHRRRPRVQGARAVPPGARQPEQGREGQGEGAARRGARAHQQARRQRLEHPDGSGVPVPQGGRRPTACARSIPPRCRRSRPPGPGGGGANQLTPAQIKKMMEEMQKKQKSGGDPHGGH